MAFTGVTNAHAQANSMLVSRMKFDNHNKKLPGLRQVLNLLRPRSLGGWGTIKYQHILSIASHVIGQS